MRQKYATSIGSAPADAIKSEAATSPTPFPVLENKPAPGQTGPRGLSPRTTYSRVNSVSPPASPSIDGLKSSPARGAEFLPAKMAQAEGLIMNMAQRPTIQDMVKAAMQGTADRIEVTKEAARQIARFRGAEEEKTASAQDEHPEHYSTEHIMKMAEALEYIAAETVKEADEGGVVPGEGPGALEVSESNVGGTSLEAGQSGHAISADTVPMNPSLQPEEVQGGKANTGLETNDDTMHGEQPLWPITNETAKLSSAEQLYVQNLLALGLDKEAASFAGARKAVVDAASKAKGHVSSGAKKALHGVHAGASYVKDKSVAGAKAVKDKAVEGAEASDQAIKGNPYKSMAAAGGLGLAGGAAGYGLGSRKEAGVAGLARAAAGKARAGGKYVKDKAVAGGKYVGEKATSGGQYAKGKAESAGKYTKDKAQAGAATADRHVKQHPYRSAGIAAGAGAAAGAGGGYAFGKKKKAGVPIGLIRKLAEDAINPAQISAGSATPPDFSESGEGNVSVPSDVSSQVSSMLSSNQAAIDYTKGQAKANPKADVNQLLAQPALTREGDSVLQQVFSNTGVAGVKISHAHGIVGDSVKVAAARALLANLADETKEAGWAGDAAKAVKGKASAFGSAAKSKATEAAGSVKRTAVKFGKDVHGGNARTSQKLAPNSPHARAAAKDTRNARLTAGGGAAAAGGGSATAYHLNKKKESTMGGAPSSPSSASGFSASSLG